MAKKLYRPFRVHRSTDNQFYFTVVAKNGDVDATSKPYKRKASVVKVILSIANSCQAFANPYLDLTSVI